MTPSAKYALVMRLSASVQRADVGRTHRLTSLMWIQTFSKPSGVLSNDTASSI